MTKTSLKRAAASFGRILAACSATAYALIGKTDLTTWNLGDVERFGWAVASALALTAVNAWRKGDTRFGRNAGA